MKAAIKYGLICGILMVFFQFLPLIPNPNWYIDSTVIGLANIVIICGTIMYAINNHLKYHNTKGNYNYGTGFLIGIETGLIGTFILSFAFYLVSRIKLGSFGDPWLIFIAISPKIPLLLICSSIIPILFITKGKRDREKIVDEDILDSEI